MWSNVVMHARRKTGVGTRGLSCILAASMFLMPISSSYAQSQVGTVGIDLSKINATNAHDFLEEVYQLLSHGVPMAAPASKPLLEYLIEKHFDQKVVLSRTSAQFAMNLYGALYANGMLGVTLLHSDERLPVSQILDSMKQEAVKLGVDPAELEKRIQQFLDDVRNVTESTTPSMATGSGTGTESFLFPPLEWWPWILVFLIVLMWYYKWWWLTHPPVKERPEK